MSKVSKLKTQILIDLSNLNLGFHIGLPLWDSKNIIHLIF
jgi:hypothetical protein